MADTIKGILSQKGILGKVILSPEADVILSSLEITDSILTSTGMTGNVKLKSDVSDNPIPGFNFALVAPDPSLSAPFKLEYLPQTTSPTSFKFWLNLGKLNHTLFAFKFITELPGLVFTGAKVTHHADGTVSLDAFPPSDKLHVPVLVSRSPSDDPSLGPHLLITGNPETISTIRVVPDNSSIEGVVALGLEPPAVVFGNSGIGFECQSVVIDDSETYAATGSGAPTLDPPKDSIDADTPLWKGILIRELSFYLPSTFPLFGGRPIHGYFEIPYNHGGIRLVASSKVLPQAATADHSARLGYSVRIECIDPTARGLSGIIPTLISATMELPLDGSKDKFKDKLGNQHEINFGGGKPILLTATFARDPINQPGSVKISLGTSSQGKNGILSVDATGYGGAKIFNTVASMATALIADGKVNTETEVGNTPGVILYSLLAAGTALSSLFEDDSSHFVLHGLEIESTGHGAPMIGGGKVTVSIDYSVALRVKGINVGALFVEMLPDQPMRIRIRKARLSIDPSKSGLSMIGLDFSRAQIEVENPGAWTIQGLDSLFDVIGSRSGRGSSWVEVDLRFKINLGPIKVSGATIRATLEDNGTISASIRGLKVDLNIPGAMDGSGQLQLIQGGFSANLRASIIPINLGVDAGIIYNPPMIVLRLGVDLPAPIPLANTGFGLFGIGGMLGISAIPNYGGDINMDPVLRQLKWNPEEEGAFTYAGGQSTFGFVAAVGTFPDLGFSFSAKAGILLTIPDLSIRGSLNGRVIQPPVKVSDPSYPPSQGISFLGFIGIDKDALSLGLIGSINLRPLLDIKVPLSGHFPFGANSDNWYVYLGTDGYDGQGRELGPVYAHILPDLLDLGADAYVMIRGRGIENWPHNRGMPPLTIMDGLVVAFGFGMQNTFGPKPVVWADLFASIDVLVGGSSPTLAGFGRAGGSLNLGPFSLGVQSRVNVIISEAGKYFWAEVTGRIKLLFVTIRGTVTISIGGKPNLELPYPEVHPLDILDKEGHRKGILGCISDDTYRVVTRLMEDPAMITDDMRVWPDAIVSIPFAFPVDVSSGAFSQFPSVDGINAPSGSFKIGNEMLNYVWRLESLKLIDVTDEADPFVDKPGIAGHFSSKWQVPRALSSDSSGGVGGGGNGDTTELLLFSTSESLWVNRLADGGKSNPGHPLEHGARICRQKVFAMTGWAIGFKARELEKGFCLPQDFLIRGKYASNFEVYVHHKGIPIEGPHLYSLDDTFTIPVPFSIKPASLVKWPEAQEIKHMFFGHLNLPCLQWISGKDIDELLNGQFKIIGQQIDLVLSEPLVDVMLILVADERSFFAEERFVGIQVFDNLGQTWREPEFINLPTGDNAVLFRSPHSEQIIQISVTFPMGKSLGIVGVGGTTQRSIDAALKANKHIINEIDSLSNAANAGPKTDPAINTAHQRNILEPGHIYRIDVNMAWSGEMSRQKEDGQTEIIPEDPANIKNKNEYRPKGTTGANLSTNKKLFFKTAKKAEPQPQRKYGDKQYVSWLYSKQDVFHPEMIERYLSGYDPSQSQEFYFRNDPLRVHFLQDHVAALAKAYGFNLKIKVERLDKARPISPISPLNPKWSFITDPLFLNKTDQLRYDYAVTSDCILPKPGATAMVNPELEPEALYDIHLLAEPEDTTAFNSCRLPGVTFKTSRWRNPSEMLNGLGFEVSGSSIQPDHVVSGDLVINKGAFPAPFVQENNDQVFETALLNLGLEGWPVTQSPRLSRLWIHNDEQGKWLFAGLMIESSEPIYRKDRLEISSESLKVITNPVGFPVFFDVYISDLSGSRILYLTTVPIPLDDPNTTGISTNVQLTMKSILLDPATATNTITEINGILALINRPSFSEDPA